MTKSEIKFHLVDNTDFHKSLEQVSTSVFHHKTMKQMFKILDEPVDASVSIFKVLPKAGDGKAYYPFFLREPFSLENIDFCKLIKKQHVQLMQEKKLIPLICMLTESWVLFNFERNRKFRNSPYFNVINQLVQYGINEEDVVWLTCNKYHRPDPRIRAKFLHFDFFLEQQKILKNQFMPLQNIKHKFISLARGVERHHRYAMTYELFKNDLLKHGAVSCSDYKNFSYQGQTSNTDDYMQTLENFDIDSFGKFKKMLPLVIDSATTKIVVPKHEAWQSPINLHQDGRDESHLFDNVFLNIVNETHQPDELIFVTEKTYRSINYCRPFVVNGDRGTLRYLKDMGFRTFDKFWDESYDAATSDHVRIGKILKITRQICAMDEKSLLNLYVDMVPTLEYNYKYLKNFEQWNQLN